MSSSSKDELVRAPQEDRDPRGAEEYWTLDRMAQAPPVPRPIVQAPLQPAETEQGEPGATEARQPTIHPKDELVDEADKYRAAPPYSTFRVPLDRLPFSAVGNLYIRWTDSSGGTVAVVGSAWVLGTRAIITAGHCVYNSSLGWARDIVFAPQYSNGPASFTDSSGNPVQSTWKVTGRMWTLEKWIISGDLSRDMAIAVTDTPITPWTGNLGSRWNISPNPWYTELGYPASAVPGYAFDGKYQWESLGNYVGRSGDIIEHYANLTSGASGGPWMMLDVDKHLVNANGIISHGHADRPDSDFSPYFGDTFGLLVARMNSEGAA
jgi:V8-like Glu-specific endopeptidase